MRNTIDLFDTLKENLKETLVEIDGKPDSHFLDCVKTWQEKLEVDVISRKESDYILPKNTIRFANPTVGIPTVILN